MIALLTVGGIVPTIGHEDLNPRGYEILVPNYHGNGQEDKGYLRSPGDSNTQWGVSLTDSKEGGANTYTTFWLEKSSGANVTDAHDVQLGKGFKQFNFEKASDVKGKYVYLTAENNNYISNSYSISGKWDEEI